MPKYTFLLPAFKGHFFREALESIQAQTYKDFSVIISDDCSPDDLRTIAEPFLADPRFTYRRNEKNIGGENLVNHWNLLVDMCETPWLIMASDDDVYDPHFLEEIDKLQEKYPKVDLLHARAQMITQDGEIVQRDAIYEECVTQLEFISQYQYFNHVECIANHAFRTEELKKNQGFFPFPYAWASDTATTNYMAHNGAANTRDILFSFRMSGENISSINHEDAKRSRARIQAMFQYHEVFNNLLSSITPVNKSEINLYKKIAAFHKNHVFGGVISYSNNLPFFDFLQVLRELKKRKLHDSNYDYIKFIRWHIFKK